MGGQIRRKRLDKIEKLKAIDLQIKHHRIYLNYRAQDRIIQGDAFAEAWNLADEKQRYYMVECLDRPNPSDLKKWIAKILIGGLEQYSVQILRQIASYHHVKNYSRMSKTQLLVALEEKPNGSKDRT